MTSKVSLQAFLEIRNDDGSTVFCALDRVLRSPDLQARCIDKQELHRVCRLIDEDPSLAKRIRDEFR
jgi:hypothetical protein